MTDDGMMPACVPSLLEAWSSFFDQPQTTVVVPDGCQDVIGRLTADGVRWFITPLADATYTVSSQAGEAFVGYRLQPGTWVDEAALLRVLNGRCLSIDAQPWLDAYTRRDAHVSEALAALSVEPTIAAAARGLGLSPRSLERLMRTSTRRSPNYWRQLARSRRAALALSSDVPLAQIAADAGYADQAHFNRDMRRWFGASPTQLRLDPSMQQAIALSGFC